MDFSLTALAHMSSTPGSTMRPRDSTRHLFITSSNYFTGDKGLEISVDSKFTWQFACGDPHLAFSLYRESRCRRRMLVKSLYLTGI
ncbi:hypothetical protein CEXT_235091 [Caerostris extrusa]|uniref:Uncharacterized protein n=1 Tax=Caerostris extrusa TaxID=172846 RepID=A0AAV4NNI1_CAEEX|nr:hypothetical protein CEXT_235091 [Caerostris extrusa]